MKDTATGPVLECISREEQVCLSLLFFVFVAFSLILCFVVAVFYVFCGLYPKLLDRCALYTITSGVPHLLHHPVHSKARRAMPSTIQEAVSYHHRWLLQQLLYFFTMSIFFVTDVVQSKSTSKVCLRPLQRICG